MMIRSNLGVVSLGFRHKTLAILRPAAASHSGISYGNARRKVRGRFSG